MEDEIIETFLPNLRIDGWNFNPNKKLHRKLGSHLWKSTSPSLRRLVQGLETACSLNKQTGSNLNFSDLIKAACYASNSLKNSSKGDDSDETESSESDIGKNPLGEHESRSRNRHLNRHRGKKGS
jgi:hypothetical protein